jgi:uncharacterized protein (TIGR03790 family)
MQNRIHRRLFLLSWLASIGSSLAGGSGLNVVVVVNQASPQSIELGNYYCEKRAVPHEHQLRIHWTNGAVEWTRSEFETSLLQPLATWMQDRGLTNQIEYLVLSMDIPYRITETAQTNGPGRNSTTSVLFYGWQPDTNAPGNLPRSCSLPPAALHPYADSETLFRAVQPPSAWSNWLVTMITASNLAQAKAIVDRGVAADESWPTQAVYLTKSTDPARNVRHWAFEDAIFEQRVLNRVTMLQTNVNSPGSLGPQLGSQSGYYGFSMPPNLFVPGAMADNLTSYGGLLFEDAAGMTRVPDFLAAGATASYGTVVEPCNWMQKFPNPRNYYYQARGFSIAECYYQSVAAPYQGILVGEPLAAPFARRPRGEWLAPAPDATLSGTALFAWHFQSADPTRPIGRVDLFLNGRFFQTIWNAQPAPGNIIRIQLAEHTIEFHVPESANLASIAQALADLLNQPEHTNTTGVLAQAIGDRLVLQSVLPDRTGASLPIAVETQSGTNTTLNLFLTPARPVFLDSTALGFRSFTLRHDVATNDWLHLTVAHSHGLHVSIIVTNETATNTAGLVQKLLNAINTHPDLQGTNGVIAEDFRADTHGTNVSFVLRARAHGWQAAAALQAELRGAENLTIEPSGPQSLEENLEELRPRNHIYLACGVTNLSLRWSFDTTGLPDGWHEGIAVAYEGTHVATQGHLRRRLRVANSNRSASLVPWFAGPLTQLSVTQRWAVHAHPAEVSHIELFTTAGLWARIPDTNAAVFEVPGPWLGPGLHPFYAVVTWQDGRQYRTETQWVRVVADDFSAAPIRLEIQGPPWQVRWPAVVGKTYTLWTTTNLALPFLPHASWTATNAPAVWDEPDPSPPSRFYRVTEGP